MLEKFRSQVTYANVMATIAVFIAMGGGAYALSLPKNSVDSKQIQRNAVGASEIRARAVASSEVRDGSLRSADFQAGQLPAGPQGATGPPGPATGVAGGDLTGSYPNPSIAANAVAGGDVANDSLTGTDVDELTLGPVPNATDAAQLDGIDSTGFGTGALLGRVNSLAASGPATQYGSPLGTSVAGNESDVQFISTQSPMVVRELRVFIPGGIPAGTSRTFTLRVGFADTPLSCTAVAPNFGCSNLSDEVFMQFGSGLAIEVETSGSPGVQAAAFSLRATAP